MELIILSVFGFAVLAIVIRLLKDKLQKSELTYSSKNYLLTKNEQNFYLQLLQHLPDGQAVMSKVRLIDIVKPNGSKRDYMKLRNKIISKHVDFLIIEKSTSKILLAIELDDSSHLNLQSQTSDSVKNDILASAKIPLERIRTSKTYSFDWLSKTSSQTPQNRL